MSLCSCSCGKEKVIATHAIKKIGGTRSCGCLKVDRMPFGISIRNNAILAMKHNAKNRGYVWELENEEVLAIMDLPCYYCGRLGTNGRTHMRLGKTYSGYNGIDRRNNSKGYTKENSVPCCKQCNIAKGTLTLDEFIELCYLVTNKNQK